MKIHKELFVYVLILFFHCGFVRSEDYNFDDVFGGDDDDIFVASTTSKPKPPRTRRPLPSTTIASPNQIDEVNLKQVWENSRK